MARVRSSFSLVTTPTRKATSYTIQILGRQSLIEMSYLMKKENGTRDHMMKTTTFSRTLKKKTWSNQG